MKCGNEDEWFKINTEMDQLCDRLNIPLTDPRILVNVDNQRMYLVKMCKLMNVYTISTAINGTGQREGSGQTPLGLHRIEELIGDGADPWAVFESRIPTGQIAAEGKDPSYIVGRIFRLFGLQPGLNQGMDSSGESVDTYQRYIYIHGTNDARRIGQPVSHGCIRMNPHDVVDLFGRVLIGTLIYIYTERDSKPHSV